MLERTSLRSVLRGVSVPRFVLGARSNARIGTSSLATSKGRVLVFLRRRGRPARRVLGRVVRRRRTFTKCTRRVVFMIEDGRTLRAPALSGTLTGLGGVRVCCSSFSRVVGALKEHVCMSPSGLPLVVIAGKALGKVCTADNCGMKAKSVLLELVWRDSGWSTQE